MSQAKVDRYKEEKANRKKIMKQEKIKRVLRNIAAFAVIVVLIGWLGVSVYNVHEENQPRQSVEVDYNAVDSYLNSIEE